VTGGDFERLLGRKMGFLADFESEIWYFFTFLGLIRSFFFFSQLSIGAFFFFCVCVKKIRETRDFFSFFFVYMPACVFLIFGRENG
jgi:hypothetical protein